MEICPICDKPSELEGHHIIPISYGGAIDGALINICSTCHQSIHYQAEAMCSATWKKHINKRKFYLSANDLNKPVTKDLISAIILAKQKFRKDENPNVPRKIYIEVPNHMLVNLHKCKVIDGFSSLDRYIIKILSDYINKKLV